MVDDPKISPPPTNGLTKYRQDKVETEVENLKEKVDKLTDEITKIKIELANLQGRMTIFQALQVTFTTIAGVVASFIGRLN